MPTPVDLDVELTVGIVGAMAGVTPVMRAAAKAVLQARRAPGCLVRVTFKRDELDETLACIFMAGQFDIDFAKTKANKPARGAPVLVEFRNGSAIELVMQEKGTP